MDRPQNLAPARGNPGCSIRSATSFGGCASASGPSRDTSIGSGGSSCTSPKHYIHVIPVHHVPRKAASRGAVGGGRGGVSDRSRGQQQRRVVHTEPRAERHGVALRANIEKRIRPACGCPTCQEAGQATDRVHPRRRAIGLGALAPLGGLSVAFPIVLPLLAIHPGTSSIQPIHQAPECLMTAV